jgi:hypothetical protein
MKGFLEGIGFLVEMTIDEWRLNIKSKYKKLLDISKSQKKKTNKDQRALFFVYYSGHGYVNTTTYGVNKFKENIPIEKWLRRIAMYPNTYTIGLFDCIRM